MGLGWSGAYGAAGGADALQQLLAQRKTDVLKAQELARQHLLDQQAQQQQSFQNARLTANDTQNQAVTARNIAKENFELLNGQASLADLPGGPVGMEAAPGLPSLPGTLVAGQAPPTAPARFPFHKDVSAMEIPGAAGAPGIKLRPMGKEQVQAEKAATEEFTLPDGSQKYRGNQLVAENVKAPPAAPRNFAPESGYIGPKGEPVSHDPTTDKYFIGGQEVPLSAIHQKPPQRDTAAHDEGRLDKSYQYNSTQLENMRKPIADRAERLGRAMLTVNEQSPQADSVIAPELITVMAGGAGSGVRITTAEINAVLGGRTNFESLKAALNKWQLDPSKGLSVTPAQRGQIQHLLGRLNERVTGQLALINDGARDLAAANNVDEHRRIVTETRKKFDAMSLGSEGAGGSGKISVTAPDGSVHEFDTPDQAAKFKQLARIK